MTTPDTCQAAIDSGYLYGVLSLLPEDRRPMVRQIASRIADYWRATPPAAAQSTSLRHPDGSINVAAIGCGTPPAAATSTPCASGEGLVSQPLHDAMQDMLNIDAKLTKPRLVPYERMLISDAIAALAATQAPAVPADSKAEFLALVTEGHRIADRLLDMLREDSRTPTAGNTEDARSMGASEIVQAEPWLKADEVRDRLERGE